MEEQLSHNFSVQTAYTGGRPRFLCAFSVASAKPKTERGSEKKNERGKKKVPRPKEKSAY
jgi:hypothetical protein